MKKIVTIAMGAALLLQVSCRKDSDNPSNNGAYDDGFFITNEGNFGTPNASVDFLSSGFDGVQSGVYNTVNAENVGDVFQSMAFHDDHAYMVVNNSNKVVVANRYTMKKETVITQEINKPRYATFQNNKLYVTNSAYGGAQYVSVYNSDNTYATKIEFNATVERIFNVGNKVFVQNASFGYGNQYSYINPSSDTLEATYTIPQGQITKAVPYQGYAYILAKGSSDSYIYKINTSGDVTKTYTLSGISNAKNLDIEADKIYFTSGTGIYKMGINSTSAPSTPVIEVEDNSWSTLYGFEVIGNVIFTSDANGFTEGSTINVYSGIDNSLLKTFTAGIGTNGFYLNN